MSTKKLDVRDLLRTAKRNHLKPTKSYYLSNSNACAAGLVAVHFVGMEKAKEVINFWKKDIRVNISEATGLSPAKIFGLEDGFTGLTKNPRSGYETCPVYARYVKVGQRLEKRFK